MGISSVGYPGKRENCTLAGVVCLNPHSNTDLYTHTVIHMKDWWLWMTLLQVQMSLILWWPTGWTDASKSTKARPWACFILVRIAKSAYFTRLWALAETPGKEGMPHPNQTLWREMSAVSPQETLKQVRLEVNTLPRKDFYPVQVNVTCPQHDYVHYR